MSGPGDHPEQCAVLELIPEGTTDPAGKRVAAGRFVLSQAALARLNDSGIQSAVADDSWR